MLFSKYIDPCCSYCKKGSRISPTEVMCLRRGIVDSAGFCRKFEYDPLKREPVLPSKLINSEYSPEDFKI